MSNTLHGPVWFFGLLFLAAFAAGAGALFLVLEKWGKR